MGTEDLLMALGIEEGVVYEFVCTTFSPDGSPHASAMGCTFLRDSGGLSTASKLSRASRTAANVLARRCFALNVVHPEAVVEAALDLGVLEMEFEAAESVDAPRLRGAAAVIECSVVDVSEDNDWFHVRSRPVRVSVLGSLLRPFSRGHAALLEAAVHASRIRVYEGLGEPEKAGELRSRVSALLESAVRLAPTPTVVAQSRAIRSRYLRIQGP
ncbi:MAG: DUF447 domain-containing protein [Candidatus Caldarchaeales archaeon]